MASEDPDSDRAEDRHERASKPSLPVWAVLLVVIGAIVVVHLTTMNLTFVWWERAILSSIAVFFALMKLRARFRLPCTHVKRVDRRAPPERTVVKPELWEAFAVRLGFTYDGGRHPSMEGAVDRVPVRARFRRRPCPMTEVTARLGSPSTWTLKLRRAQRGEGSFEDAFEVQVGLEEALDVLLPDDVRRSVVELVDLELELGHDALTIRTLGFEGEEDRLLRILDLAVRIVRLAGTSA